MEKAKRCALVLAGCGAKDGAEITESVSLMIAFAQFGFKVQVFAANRPFFHVINHFSDEVVASEERNILIESARIARGHISPLEVLHQDNFDVLCFAGGFGVAKNYCNFALAGQDAVLENDIKKVIFDFIKAKKIVSALCIAPVLIALAAKELKLTNPKVTLGASTSDAAHAVESWGVIHEAKRVTEACVDIQNKFVTAPAYMDDKATSADIFASATALVKGVETLL